MIIQEYSKYTFICDVCSGGTDHEFDTFDEAVQSKKDIGWASRKRINDWIDICPDCQKEA